MDFTKDNYKLELVHNDEGININLYDINNQLKPLMFLNLKPLNEVDTEDDDKTVIRDIPRHMFLKGDYYQSSVNRHTDSNKNKDSLLSVVHDMILINREALPFIKSIFSSSLNRHREEFFLSDDAINFWNIQLEKKPNIPISYFKKDRRYKLEVNSYV